MNTKTQKEPDWYITDLMFITSPMVRRKIFSCYLNGMSIDEIAFYLDTQPRMPEYSEKIIHRIIDACLATLT